MPARHLWPIVVALALLTSAARADESSPRVVTTTGTATVYVVPDRADIRFTVHAFDADLAKAKSQNDTAAEKVLAFLKENGIEEKSIATEFASTEPVYEDVRRDDGRIERGPIKGYNVSRSYGARLDDLSKFGAIIDRLLTDANVTAGGHTFSSKQDRTHRDRARRDAAVAAREKAQLLAQTLDMRLGAPRSITEVASVPIYRPVFTNAMRDAGSGGSADEIAPVGQIEVRAEVNVSFDVEPRQ